MKHICIGTTITLLYQGRKRNTYKIKTICDGIFATYSFNIKNYSKELPSRLKPS